MIQLCFLQHRHFHVEGSLFHLIFVQHNEATINHFTCIVFSICYSNTSFVDFYSFPL